MEKKIENQKNEQGVDIEHINEQKEFLQVDFDFLEPDKKYNQSIQVILKKTFRSFNFNTTSILEQLSKQNEFGILLGINEDRDSIHACLSIINLKRFSEEFKKSLFNFVYENMDQNSKDFMINNQEGFQWGILVNERVVNLPMVVVPVLFQQLMEDKYFIENSKEFTDEEKQEFQFDYLMYFTVAQKTKENDKKEEIKFLFSKIEDKLFYKKAFIKHDMNHFLGEDFVLIFMVIKFEDYLSITLSEKTFKQLIQFQFFKKNFFILTYEFFQQCINLQLLKRIINILYNKTLTLVNNLKMQSIK